MRNGARRRSQFFHHSIESRSHSSARSARFISITRSGIGFGSGFIKKYRLLKMRTVRISHAKAKGVLTFAFSDDRNRQSNRDTGVRRLYYLGGRGQVGNVRLETIDLTKHLGRYVPEVLPDAGSVRKRFAIRLDEPTAETKRKSKRS